MDEGLVCVCFCFLAFPCKTKKDFFNQPALDMFFFQLNGVTHKRLEIN